MKLFEYSVSWIIVVLGIYSLAACNRLGSRGASQDYDALKGSMAGCEEPAVSEIRPWGETGQSYGCYIKNGPFIAAEDGYVRLRGQFDNGKERGVWRWYDRNGNVVKEVDFSTRK